MKADVVVVGGGPAGIITALTTKRVYPDASVALIKEVGDGVIPCAIPYMINTLADPDLNRLGDDPLIKAGVEVVVARVDAIDPTRASVTMKERGDLAYKRLVLATGSSPISPPIPGVDLDGVFLIQKSLSAMRTLRERARRAKNIVIIGGGFIGAELADELTKEPGRSVRLVEMMPRIMSAAFDDGLCEEVEQHLRDAGVDVCTSTKITGIQGSGSVDSVVLENGERLAADMVIIGIGARPASRLAQEAGLLTTRSGAVWVDSYMRTTEENIFAVGDCALKRDFFTRREIPVMLASNATAEARIAGTNLFGIRAMRQVQGTISAFSTKIGQVSLASAGMTCRSCEAEGFRNIVGVSEAPDRHPGALPGATKMKVTLIFAHPTGTLLGAQMSGGSSVGELINMAALAIEKKVTARELEMMQIATHPLLTPAPTVHPVIQAATVALSKMCAPGEVTA